MEYCPMCGGEKIAGPTIYSVDLGFGVVVVRNVPAKICNQCGEEWIEDVTAKELEKVIENARTNHCQLEVIPFSVKAV